MYTALCNDPNRIVVTLCDGCDGKLKLLSIDNHSIEAKHIVLGRCIVVLNDIPFNAE